MPLLQCPSCGESSYFAASLAGHRVLCPNCSQPLTVTDGQPPRPDPAGPAVPGPARAGGGRTDPRGQFGGEVDFLPDDGPEDRPPPLPRPVHGPRRRTEGDAAGAVARHYAPVEQDRGAEVALGLGIAALVAGVFTAPFALIPRVGMLALPVAGVGLLLGVSGVFVALARRGAGIGFPAAGVTVNGVTIAVTLFWFSGGAAPQAEPEKPGGRPAPVAEATPDADRRPVRPRPPAEPVPAPQQPRPPEPPPPAPPPAREEPMARYREGLKSPDAGERRAAAAGLGGLGAAAGEALPELTAALRDPDAGVRAAAVEALAALGPPAGKSYADLVRAAGDEDAQVRRSAERFLRESVRPPAEAAPGLVELAGDPKQSADTRARALAALARCGLMPVTVTPLYLACLKAPDEAVREQAARCLAALGKTPDRAALPALFAALGDASVRVQEAAARAIDALGPPDRADVPALREALQSDAARVRVAALRGLAGVGRDARDSATDVWTALRDKDPSVRRAAAESLVAVAPERAGDAAVLLADRDRDVRKGTAVLLRRQLDPAKCFEVFTDALAAPDEATRKDAAEALDQVEVSPTADVPDPVKVRLAGSLSDVTPLVRVKAAKALARVGWRSETQTAVLAKLLAEEGGGVSRDAAETLRQLGPPATRRAAEQLVRALGSRDAATRRASAAALRSAGPLKPAAKLDLIAALADEAVHDDVAPLLAAFGEGAVDDLVRALESPGPETRSGAAKALGEMGPKAAEAYRALTVRFQKDPSDRVRRAAGKAMDEIRKKP